MKQKTKHEIIGCNLIWGDNITDKTAKYCNQRDQIRGTGDCLTDIMVAERGYIYKKAWR